MYEYPYGDTQQLNLDWFLTEFKNLVAAWEAEKAGIDGALDDEIARAEAALADVFAARDAAAASATAAAASASSAGTSATAAGNSATAAAASATTANTKAAAASASETSAANSAQSASNSSSNATQKATAAAASETNAAASATAAANSATAAAASETNAAASETNAAASAQTAEDVLDSIPADYSTLSNDVATLKSNFNNIDPIFNMLIKLPADNSFFVKTGLTGVATYRKISNNQFTFTGGSGSAYHCYPLHGTNRVVSGTDAQLPERLLPTDFVEIPEHGAWYATSLAVGLRTILETNSTTTNQTLQILLLGANIENDAFTAPPVLISTAAFATGYKYGSTVIPLRTNSRAPLTQYTHYAIFARSRSRSSALVQKATLEIVQDANTLNNVLYGDIGEITTTASRNYAVNSFLIYKNQLYRVTSPIATGETFAAGTNVVATNVVAELTRILNS